MTVSAEWSWWRVALAGMRDALSLPAWVVGFGLVGIGSLARDVGYPVEVAVLSTMLVWAGPRRSSSSPRSRPAPRGARSRLRSASPRCASCR